MSDDSVGFFINKLTVTGPGKKAAELSFNDGLNVVSGASDTCAAFIVGIMQHCRGKNLPHPSVVVLDSPLVAYREPDSTSGDAKKFRQAGVKEAFYRSMASTDMSGQVIVFENEDPPENLTSIITRHHFTKSNSGRYGFFPR